MSLNTISTECTPQQEINFDEIFPIETNDKETSDFNFLDMKPNPDFIKICKNSLKLSKINENENILIDDNNSKLKRAMSYSDLKINMKKEEEFNLETSLNKKNIDKEKIYSYLMEEMKEKIYIEEDYKYDEEELYYDDEEEEEEDEELINAILMYNSRNISNDYRKIIRERLKRRIKEDEKKYKKEEKMYKENEKKRELKVKQKEKELLLKPQKKGDNGSLFKLLNSDLLDENLFIRYLSVDTTSITDFLINILYNKKNIRKFIPNILHEIICIYAFKKNGLESISKFLIDYSIKNVSFGIKTVLIILSLINLSSSNNKTKLINLKNEIESNISLLTNNYNLKQMSKKNLSIYNIKNIDELELFDEIDMEVEGNKNTPDYVFFSKYYEMTMDFYNEIYLLPKKIEQFIQQRILNNNMSKNSYKVSKMDNHSLIQTEFINLINEINNKIGNLSQYRERIKEEIKDEKIKLKLKSLFTGYILPLNYKNKNTKIIFDIDNFENNYILINIIPDYSELKFTEADKYLKKFNIKLAFEIIQVKEAKSWEEVINDKNKKVKNKIITVSEKKKRELYYEPFNYIFNGNPNLEYIKNSSQYHNFNTYNIIFYKLLFDKDLTGDIIINQFKKYFNNLFLNSNNEESNNNSTNEIKMPDIIPLNENCFLVECIEYNNNLISLKQIESDIKIYKIKNNYNDDNKENNNININTKQINSKYKLFEESENQDPNNIFFAKFIYDSFGTNLIENDTLQKNLIESFICNILIEYLFNNKEINTNSQNNDIFNYLYIDKEGFLTLINNNNHYLSTDNSLINNKFKLNNELFQLLTDNDVGSDSFQYFTNLIIYYICEIKKYYDTFENYINVFLNSNGVRPLNWSNKLKDWIIYSLQERFFWNKTDIDITNKLKKDISEINMKKNNTTSKFKFFIDSVKAKIHRKKFD